MATEARETGSLIGSDKVEGTAVYGEGPTPRTDKTDNTPTDRFCQFCQCAE